MTNIKLLIVDGDKEYAEALARQIALKHKGFSVTTESGGTLKEDMLELYDLILVGDFVHPLSVEDRERQERTVALFQQSGRCLLLRSNQGGHAEPGECAVFRYGRVSQLVSLLRITYGKVFGKESRTVDFTGKTRIVGFLSGAGGTGKTAAALTFCKLLSREQGKKTLYLSFEEFDATAFYMNFPEEGKSIRDFLYYFCSRREDAVATYLDAFLFCDECGVFSFRPAKARNDLRTLSEAELIRLFTILFRYGEFHCIVIDFPVSFDETMLFLIKSCSSHFLISDERSYSMFQCARLKSWMEEELGISEEELTLINVDWEEDNFELRQGGMDIDIHHHLGRRMRTFAERMVL